MVRISRVQAIQRTGRAGRTQAGKCYRMYSEQFFKEQMIENTVPEILRVVFFLIFLINRLISQIPS